MYLYLTMLSKRRQVCDTIYIRRPFYGLLTRNGKCNGIQNHKALMSLCSTYCIVDGIELTNTMHCIIFILDAYLTRNSRFCKWEQITKNNTFGNNRSTTLDSKYASNVKMIQHIVFVSSIPSTIQYVLHITAEIHFYGCSVWVLGSSNIRYY